MERLGKGRRPGRAELNSPWKISTKQASPLVQMCDALSRNVPKVACGGGDSAGELRQYLEFSVKWANQSTKITARLGIPDQSAPAAAYNKILDVQAYGNNETADLLRCDVSAS